MFLQKLQDYKDRGLLHTQVHPRLPLTIWNYTPKTQYESLWDDITIMCRGLVTDNFGNIVARPFPKFFNIEENRYTPTKDFEVFEKMDGSLGIFFYYKGEPVFASRGSFTSEQAIKGREILDKYNWQYGTYEGYTYMFEIVYPQNRIVVDYGDIEELFVLGVIETVTGDEVNFHEMQSEGFILAKKYNGIKDYTTLKKQISDNAEGFIVKFSNGDRVKIKGEEYLRLHKILTNLSNLSVWELLSSGSTVSDLIQNVPDEFFDKVDEIAKDLCIRFDNIKRDYMSYFLDITNRVVSTDRRAFAEEAKRFAHPSLLFSIMDGKDIDSLVWKIIKPKFEKI
jgi:RNA ligase